MSQNKVTVDEMRPSKLTKAQHWHEYSLSGLIPFSTQAWKERKTG